MPSRSCQLLGVARTGVSATHRGLPANCLAQAVAWSTVSPSGQPGRSSPVRSVIVSSTPSACTTMSLPSASPRHSTVIPGAPARSGPPSTISTTCPPDDRWCGVHFSHSHSPAAEAPASARTETSSGPCRVTSWQIAALTRSRTATASPVKQISPGSVTLTVSGEPSTVERPLTSARTACAVTGSTSSPRPASGATSRTPIGTRPRPTRTQPNSLSLTPRSHMRALPAIAHSVSGSGCRRWSSSYCRRAVPAAARSTPSR